MFTVNMPSVALCHILLQVDAKCYTVYKETLSGTEEGCELPKGEAHTAIAVQWRQ